MCFYDTLATKRLKNQNPLTMHEHKQEFVDNDNLNSIRSTIPETVRTFILHCKNCQIYNTKFSSTAYEITQHVMLFLCLRCREMESF